MSMHTADVYEDTSGQWRYRVKAGNGETIGQSEAYSRRFSAVRAARRNTDAEVVFVFSRRGDLVRTHRR